ncbi:hypothetical protein OAO55_03735, partial [Bacteroidales bacterium]|nr:hypothetical protein [Bacteroidales bacterium]
MNTKTYQIVTLLILFWITIIPSIAQGNKAFDFENNIPEQFKCKGGDLNISKTRYGTGKSSLKWICEPGDKISYKGE